MRCACRLFSLLCLLLVGVLGASAASAQGGAPNHPEITVQGKTYSPQSIFTRNMGTQEDQTTAFPPHKIVGNIYYVGTRTLGSFLIVTPGGNILIDSTYERNVPAIREFGRAARFHIHRYQDPSGQPCARRPHGGRRW